MNAQDLHNLISQAAGNTEAFITALVFVGFLLVIPAGLIFNGMRGKRIR